jgi:hypothetical protein
MDPARAASREGAGVFATLREGFRPYRPGYASALIEPLCGTKPLAKPDTVLYRAVMGPGARHILAFFLTISLIVGGLPFAHAMPSTAPSVSAVGDAPRHDAGHTMHHQMQNQVNADTQRDDVVPGKTVNDFCKGLKCCSMCATAYIEPSLRQLDIDRLLFAVRYDLPVTVRPQAVTFVDPGIPIA